MKRSQLNLKPIKLTPIEACAFIGKAIKEYIENNPKRWKQCKYLMTEQMKKTSNSFWKY